MPKKSAVIFLHLSRLSFLLQWISRTMSFDTLNMKCSKKEMKILKKEQAKIARKGRRQERKRNNDQISSLDPNLSEYFFSNGFRRVYPYSFTYKTHAKQRWLGRTIYDVLNTEFHSHSYKSFEKAINDGKVKIGGCKVQHDYVLKDNDIITHVVHRHELPVLDVPVNTVYEDDSVLVVNKPPSIPIHPCGRYNLNSLVYILRKEQNRENIRLVHRLDRMTSGLVIFCKDYDSARRYSSDISDRKVKKTYISLVEGKFPTQAVCNAPLGSLSAKFGIHRVLPIEEGGKPAETRFHLKRYNPNSNLSIIECYPLTGRTHQIRIHLQYLGFPIINDPIYNSSAWGPVKGRGGQFGVPLDHVIDALKTAGTIESLICEENTTSIAVNNTDDYDYYPPTKRLHPESKTIFDPSKVIHDNSCVECFTTFKDPKPDTLFIYLHAYEYEGPNWKYTSPSPSWAN